MDKSELQAWESKCLQEEPPGCVAGCPLHVDARRFVHQVALGQWNEALKTLAKTMPFPRLLGRICNRPCEGVCKRGEAGGPISISRLERICVEMAQGPFQTVLLSRKETRVAVVGSGPGSLTAAWDLLRKGYRITLFEPGDRLGGRLWDIPESLLPPGLISQELALLEQLEAEIRLGTDVGKVSFLPGLRASFDAVFLGLDTPGLETIGLARDGTGQPERNPTTLATSLEGVFAGGNQAGPIEAVLDGRRAATSIDRHTMHLTLENGREREGPYPSRLHTSLEGIPPAPRLTPASPDRGYTQDEAIREAQRCLQCECLECVKVCLYLDRHKGYPKQYTRQVFNNEYVMHGRARTKNLFVNSCTDCGLCEVVCPNHFHVGDLMLQARRAMVQNKVMPPSFHEFALQDMAYSQSDAFRLCHPEPGPDQCAWLYFPSCQLCATCPGEVEASFDYLQKHLKGSVGILLDCCGAPARWAGREDLFRETQTSIALAWEGLGRPRVITACSTCRQIFQEQHPDMEIRTLWEILEDQGLPVGNPRLQTTVAITDPCTSRKDPETQARVRRIAKALGFTLEELPLHGSKAECCGYGGLVSNSDPAFAADILRHRTTPIDPPDTTLYRASASTRDYLAYCAMCRDNLVASGKRSSHLLEHLFPAMEGGDPASRGWISWSERRRNRSRVKRRILQRLGVDPGQDTEVFATMTLLMTPEVRRLIDQRRILEEDLKGVIDHAERTGQRLINHQTEVSRACFQSENVTFWVDYTPAEAGYTVHNAYCHRMKIVGVKR